MRKDGNVTTLKKIERAFFKRLERQCISEGRMRKYRTVFFFLRSLKINLERHNEDDIDKYFFFLKNSRYAEWTKLTYWKCFKKVVRSRDKNVDLRDWVFREPKMKPDILSQNEVMVMVSAASSFRDKLIISLLYESGIRSGEMLGLTTSDITFDEYGAVLRVDGKTGMRMVRIVKCANILKSWMNICSTKKVFPMSHSNLIRMIKSVALKCGIRKRVYPHLFRHSRATHLAKRLTEPEQRIYFGWDRDSDMPSTYVHLSMRDVDEKILSLRI